MNPEVASEWMNVMLEEIARKKAEEEEMRAEEQWRREESPQRGEPPQCGEPKVRSI